MRGCAPPADESLIPATHEELDTLRRALEAAESYVVDAATAALIARALRIVRKRKQTHILVGPTRAGDWSACLNDRPGITSYGKSSGEAVGWLHSYYSLAAEELWPGLRLEIRELPELDDGPKVRPLPPEER